MYRERLLNLAYKFGHLDEAVRESYSDPSSKYRFVFYSEIWRMHLPDPPLALDGLMEKYISSSILRFPTFFDLPFRRKL